MSKKCLKNDVEKLKTAPPKKASFCRNTRKRVQISVFRCIIDSNAKTFPRLVFAWLTINFN